MRPTTTTTTTLTTTTGIRLAQLDALLDAAVEEVAVNRIFHEATKKLLGHAARSTPLRIRTLRLADWGTATWGKATTGGTWGTATLLP